MDASFGDIFASLRSLFDELFQYTPYFAHRYRGTFYKIMQHDNRKHEMFKLRMDSGIGQIFKNVTAQYGEHE